MALTTLPTTADDSVGPDKVDRFPVTDRQDSISASEWNALKNAVIDMAADAGLSDGSTDDSVLAALLRAVSKPGAEFDTWAFSDDFVQLENDTEGPWTTAVSGTGSVDGIQNAGSAPSNDGFGWLQLGVSTSAGSAYLITRKDLVMMSAHGPVELRARIKLPATLASATMSIGFRNAAGTSYVLLTTTAGGAWNILTASVAGTGSDTEAISSPTPVGGQIYDIRMVINTDMTVSVYIDGALATYTAPATNSVPQGSDVLGWRYQIVWVADGPDTSQCDYIAVNGARKKS